MADGVKGRTLGILAVVGAGIAYFATRTPASGADTPPPPDDVPTDPEPGGQADFSITVE